MAKSGSKDTRPFDQNKDMIKTAFDMAKRAKARAILIYGDSFDYHLLPERRPKDIKVFLIYKKRMENEANDHPAPDPRELASGYQILDVPKLKLGRLGLLKVALLIAISAGDLSPTDKIAFLGGKAEREILDTLLVIDLSKETELITYHGVSALSESAHPDVFEGVLRLAMELANSGREGKPVGTIFVLGDHEKVLQLSRQMIMNPFHGYSEDERQILNPHLKETIREFSSLDGAFVISDDGELIAAGRYLGATTEETDVLRGLGSRHLAAAGITALTKAIAIVISESSGDIRIFKDGKTIMEIERRV